MGFGVWGLGFGVWGLGFGVWGLGFGVWGLGFGVWGLGFGPGLACFGVEDVPIRLRDPRPNPKRERVADVSGETEGGMRERQGGILKPRERVPWFKVSKSRHTHTQSDTPVNQSLTLVPPSSSALHLPTQHEVLI